MAAGDFDLVSMAEVGKLMGGDASGHVSRWALEAASLASALTGTQIHADMVFQICKDQRQSASLGGHVGLATRVERKGGDIR